MAGIFDSLFNTQVNNSNNNTSGNTTGRASSNLISDTNYKPPRNTSPWTGKDWFRDPTIPKPPEIQAYYDKHGRLPGNDLKRTANLHDQRYRKNSGSSQLDNKLLRE